MKPPPVNLKKFKKFKSDILWEKENANYESLDSDDSIDISKKVNKSNFQRTIDMDRMDLSESNIKKKEKIRKELSKAYLTNLTAQSNSSGAVDRKQHSSSLPRENKIHIFNQSDVKPLHPLIQDLQQGKRFQKKPAPNMLHFRNKRGQGRAVKSKSNFKTPSHRHFQLKFDRDKGQKRRLSYSLKKKKRIGGSKKQYLTNKPFELKEKRFKDDEGDDEQLKFY